jgi:predicted nucleic acid-binding protein
MRLVGHNSQKTLPLVTACVVTGHHGTIYLLLRMMKMKLLTKEEVFESLNEMIRMGWRCSTELYAEIIMTLDQWTAS